MTTAPEPAWLRHARTHIGLREIPGPKHNATIMSWVKSLGAKILGVTVTDDEAAWCGTFMAHCMQSVGIAPPPIAVRASSWDKWGVPCRPIYGALGRFARPGGGHIAIILGEAVVPIKGKPTRCFRILGGNQSNSVKEDWIEASRLVTARWPADVPITGYVRKLAATGEAVSRNEA
ncbi:MAG: uncharacterized protein JWQ03_3103 [Variovorax sp.]|nr:uncharacterized protein [Variovorax sp.]